MSKKGSLVISARFVKHASTEAWLRRLLQTKADLPYEAVESAVGEMRGSSPLLTELLENPKIPWGIQQAAALKIAKDIGDMLLRVPNYIDPVTRPANALMKWLSVNWINKKGCIWVFLRECRSCLPANHLVSTPINSVLIGQVHVTQGLFSELLLYKDVLSWTAIPFLWLRATTYDKKRFTLAEAIKDEHELHAISTLMALYARTAHASSDQTLIAPIARIDWRFEHMLSWPAIPAVDDQLVEWFHGPNSDKVDPGNETPKSKS